MKKRTAPAKKQSTQIETIINADKTKAEDSRLEFLYFTLNALDNRRNAVDSRSNIILVLSTTIVVFFTSLLSKDSIFYPENLFLLINAVLIAAEAVMSCIYSLLLISPLTRKRKERKKEQKSLSWFYLIANMSSTEYRKEIEKFESPSIIEELSTQTVLISKLLKKRYMRMKWVCIMQYIVLGHLFLYVASTLLLTYFATPQLPTLPQS